MARDIGRLVVLIGLLCGSLAALVTSNAFAQTGAAPSEPLPSPTLQVLPGLQVLPEDVAAVARELNCPLCQGYNLQDCPLVVCGQMREQIAAQLAAGQTAEEIKAGFVRDYGPGVLNVPPARGFYLVAWVLPVLILALGALGLGVFWWRVNSSRQPAAVLAVAPGAADAQGIPGAQGIPAAPDTPERNAARDRGTADYVERLERLAAEEDA